MMPSARRRWNTFGFILIFTLVIHIWPFPVLAGQDLNGNILIFWTEKDSLKAVTLMCMQGPRDPMGLVAIPVYIRISQGDASFTIADAYGRLGRQGLSDRLEDLFKVPIGSYLAVDQSTLDKASNIIGPVVMEGKVTTMTDIFEGTYTDGEIEPQSEIRHLAARLVEPKVLVKAPQLAWILSSEVKTNLGYKNVWGIYRVVEQQGPEILHKKALTGRDYFVDNRKYREVPPEAWKTVLSDVKTRA